MANIKYHGAVIFKDMGNGIISGKYICSYNQFPLPETARLITKTGTNMFEGIYNSVWLEIKASHYVTLEIKSTTPGNYELTWTSDIDPSGQNHKGLGFLEGDNLVACYWQ